MGNIFKKIHGYMCPIHLSLYLMLSKLYDLVAFLIVRLSALSYNSELLHFAIVAAHFMPTTQVGVCYLIFLAI